MIIEGTTLVKIEDGDIPADGHFIIPEHVTEIGEEAFNKCIKLTAVTFNKQLTKIGAYALENVSD